MIVAIDHVVVAANDLKAALSQYQTLLGCAASHLDLRDGVETAYLQTGNVAVELMAPVGESESARRLRAAIADGGEGLKSLVFAVDDIDAAHRRAERVGLSPEPIKARQTWRSFRLDAQRTHGVRVFLIQRTHAPLAAAASIALDHVVVRSADLECAAALFGARLGLSMRLDRDIGGRRLMFFRCGDAVVEIVHDGSLAGAQDRLGGMSWRVPDITAAYTRLANAGLDVSEVRQGLKPGSKVFSVRDRTCGTPTLVIETSPKRD